MAKQSIYRLKGKSPEEVKHSFIHYMGDKNATSKQIKDAANSRYVKIDTIGIVRSICKKMFELENVYEITDAGRISSLSDALTTVINTKAEDGEIKELKNTRSYVNKYRDFLTYCANLNEEALDSTTPYDFADDRVTDYVVYQIYRFRDLIPERGKGWNLTWCFSANAVDKFKKQFIDDNGKSGMNYYIAQWLQADGLDRGKLTEMLVDFREHRLAKFIYMPSEELTKKRFADTDIGFMLCMQATTGWSPLSAACQKCGHVEECIGYFEKKTPELIRLRKEYKTKNSKL